MAYQPTRPWGCAVSFLVLVFLGVPLLGWMTLGERPCDIHIGPPCAISWGWMKLINLIVVVGICGLIGWIVQFIEKVYRRDHENDE